MSKSLTKYRGRKFCRYEKYSQRWWSTVRISRHWVSFSKPSFDFNYSTRDFDSNSFSLFYSGQVFHELVCPLTVVPPQIFFNLTTLFSYPVFFCFFHAPLDVAVHFPVCLRSFRFKSLFSPFSPSVALIKNFCSDPDFFSDDVCLGSHWLFQSLLWWRWWSLNPGLCLCLTEEREILNRWTEYSTELYNHKDNGDLSVLVCP